MTTELLQTETNGFIHFVQLGGFNNLCNGKCIIFNAVYKYGLKMWKDAFDDLATALNRRPTVGEMKNWLDQNCFIGNDVEAAIAESKEYLEERERAKAEAARRAELIRKYRCEFDNAYADLYYGYGYKFWRDTNPTIENEEEAKIVWKAAFDKITEED